MGETTLSSTFFQKVEAADEFLIDVDLGVSSEARILFKNFTHIGVLHYIEVGEAHLFLLQNLDGLLLITVERVLFAALDEHHHDGLF